MVGKVMGGKMQLMCFNLTKDHHPVAMDVTQYPSGWQPLI